MGIQRYIHTQEILNGYSFYYSIETKLRRGDLFHPSLTQKLSRPISALQCKKIYPVRLCIKTDGVK